MKNIKLNKRINHVLAAAFAVWIAAFWLITVFGAQLPDAQRRGSIHMQMQIGNEKVAGGSIVLYQIGDIDYESGSYCYTDAFSLCPYSLEDPGSQQLAQNLADYAESVGAEGKTYSIGKNAELNIEDLSLGLYLIVQDKAADGYLPISPFLISVPLYEDGAYVYEVNASPKFDIIPDETTTKADETTTKPNPTTTRPDDSTVTTTEPALPQTGQLNWPVPMLAVIGLFFVVIGLMIKNSEKLV